MSCCITLPSAKPCTKDDAPKSVCVRHKDTHVASTPIKAWLIRKCVNGKIQASLETDNDVSPVSGPSGVLLAGDWADWQMVECVVATGTNNVQVNGPVEACCPATNALLNAIKARLETQGVKLDQSSIDALCACFDAANINLSVGTIGDLAAAIAAAIADQTIDVNITGGEVTAKIDPASITSLVNALISAAAATPLNVTGMVDISADSIQALCDCIKAGPVKVELTPAANTALADAIKAALDPLNIKISAADIAALANEIALKLDDLNVTLDPDTISDLAAAIAVQIADQTLTVTGDVMATLDPASIADLVSKLLTESQTTPLQVALDPASTAAIENALKNFKDGEQVVIQGCYGGNVASAKKFTYSYDQNTGAWTETNVQYLNNNAVWVDAMPPGWTAGDCQNIQNAILNAVQTIQDNTQLYNHFTTEAGCANGVPYTRVTIQTYNVSTATLNPLLPGGTRYRDSSGVETTAAPAGWALGPCPAKVDDDETQAKLDDVLTELKRPVPVLGALLCLETAPGVYKPVQPLSLVNPVSTAVTFAGYINPETGLAVTGTPTDQCNCEVNCEANSPIPLTVKKQATTVPNPAVAGSTVIWTITVTNPGAVPVQSIAVSDSVPGVTLVPAIIPYLAAGASQSVTATQVLTAADIAAGPNLSNSASAAGTGTNGAPASGSATGNAVLPAVVRKLELVKTATNVPSPVVVGSVITYTIAVTNLGNVTEAPVVVSDPGVTVVGSPIASLAPGATVNVTATKTVTAANIAAGSVSNQATATGTYNGAQISAVSGTANGNTNPTVTPLSSQQCTSTGTVAGTTTGPFSAGTCGPVASLALLKTCLDGAGYATTLTPGTPVVGTATNLSTVSGLGVGAGSLSGTNGSKYNAAFSTSGGAGAISLPVQNSPAGTLTQQWIVPGTQGTITTVMTNTSSVTDAPTFILNPVNAGGGITNEANQGGILVYDSTKFDAVIQNTVGTLTAGTVIASGQHIGPTSPTGGTEAQLIAATIQLVPKAGVTLAPGQSTTFSWTQKNTVAINNERFNVDVSTKTVVTPTVVTIVSPPGLPGLTVINGSPNTTLTANCV